MDKTSTLKIYERIISSLAGMKDGVKLFVDSDELKTILEERYEMVSQISQADIVIATVSETAETATDIAQECKPLIFATNYRILRYNPNVIGALYWKKGRSQLLFVERRLKKCNVALSNELTRYTVDSL
jgi:hypothetical protein